MNIKKISANCRLNISNAIQEAFEDRDDFNDWEIRFLESIQGQVRNGKDLTQKQWSKLLDILPTVL